MKRAQGYPMRPREWGALLINVYSTSNQRQTWHIICYSSHHKIQSGCYCLWCIFICYSFNYQNWALSITGLQGTEWHFIDSSIHLIYTIILWYLIVSIVLPIVWPNASRSQQRMLEIINIIWPRAPLIFGGIGPPLVSRDSFKFIQSLHTELWYWR